VKKILATLLVILGGESFSFAAPSIIGKGIKLGVNFARIQGEDVSEVWTGKRGFVIGGFLIYSIDDLLAFQPEIQFSRKGARYEDVVDGETSISWVNLAYLEIPVLAKFLIPEKGQAKFRPYLFTGPYLGLKLSGTTRTEWKGKTQEERIEDLKGTDFGLIFGGGADVSFGAGRVMLDIRYSWGFSSIMKIEEVKNSAFSVLLGYSFN
jgi:hypothetical protein